ncbi:MAG: hypothetical protein CVV47_10225 [Spirochaetae bacterium HGW-Spirochaetae-3]|nr:MAG: hypothetical protein CVV47_10225 [Spirochaetae bacterium HGW-Spirochaetae-3]
MTLSAGSAILSAMTILPGLTSTRKERIPAFIDALRRSDVRMIALFPTCLSSNERKALYNELEAIPGLRIPHVHLRSDCGPDELSYLSDRFGTEAFNIHPRASVHAFGPLPPAFARRIFIENVEQPPEDAELKGDGCLAPGGLCPDYSHLENARLHGMTEYVRVFSAQLMRFPVGCCHLSAIRIGVPNHWAGMWDHHEFADPSDLDYLAAYRWSMPSGWASLELENGLAEQLLARERLERLFSARLAPITGTA